jgi:glycosyltransferase involved in cell wall biosynthesis
MPRVSVIIPAYNRANYLPEALNSVFGQTLTPYEVIVIDDGSTDDTLEVLRNYEGKLRFARQDHEGVSAARNRGLALAQGDVIAWLDADDIWEADFLSTLVPFLAEHPDLDGVYCGLRHMNARGEILWTPTQRVVPPTDLFSALIEADFIVTPAIIAYKRCYEQVGAFDLEFQICEDYDMWLRLAKAFRIAGISQPLVRIRVHESSTMMRNSDALCRFRIALTEKHFGTRTGDPDSWAEHKRRAYAYAFLTCALRYIQDGENEEGWQYLREAASVWPDLLNRLDVFYELACGDQPRSYRGRVDLLNIEKNGDELLSLLGVLFANASPALRRMRRKAYGNAYLALGMLSDQAGQWGQARGYLLRGITENPELFTSPSVARRFVKLCSGQRLARMARTLRGDQTGEISEAGI